MQNLALDGSIVANRAATPTAPYSRRPPSPPYISIPLAPRGEAGMTPYTLEPTETNLGAISLTSEQLAIVTRGKHQTATDLAATWSYEQRRQAQQILDYICIGPTSIVRDHGYLNQQNISMVVVVRDARMGAVPLRSVNKACDACGLASYYVNVEDLHHLLRRLPEIIHNLNAHMINVHSQNQTEANTPRVGNILVTCDTGNDRSAAVIAAYIMAVFGASMHRVVQFISIQRFCCTFDEELKRILQIWGDILDAKADVHADSLATEHSHASRQSKQSKRGIDDVDVDIDDGVPVNSDTDRFTGGNTFKPFI